MRLKILEHILLCHLLGKKEWKYLHLLPPSMTPSSMPHVRHPCVHACFIERLPLFGDEGTWGNSVVQPPSECSALLLYRQQRSWLSTHAWDKQYSGFQMYQCSQCLDEHYHIYAIPNQRQYQCEIPCESGLS